MMSLVNANANKMLKGGIALSVWKELTICNSPTPLDVNLAFVQDNQSTVLQPVDMLVLLSILYSMQVQAMGGLQLTIRPVFLTIHPLVSYWIPIQLRICKHHQYLVEINSAHIISTSQLL
jgi:hypothetical protein